MSAYVITRICSVRLYQTIATMAVSYLAVVPLRYSDKLLGYRNNCLDPRAMHELVTYVEL